jgi:hypothetical protein
MVPTTVMAKRIKRRSAVDPARLRTALHQKLGSAYWRVSDLYNAEQPRFTATEPQGIIPHFLTSARGVCLTAETFAEDSWPVGDFRIWLARWEARLASDDLLLWCYMREQRNACEHGDGADLTRFQIPIDQEPDISDKNYAAILLSMPRNQSRFWKDGVRFKVYPDKPVSEVCISYLKLCRRFVDDFLQENAARADGSQPPSPATSASARVQALPKTASEPSV